MKTFNTIAISSCGTLVLTGAFLCLINWNERVGVWFSGGADTIYASGYSEAGFSSISQGMVSNDVYRLVSAPLRVVHTQRDGQPEVAWMYSDSSPTNRSGNFLIRIVVFDTNGVVLRTESGLYVD